MEHPATVLIHKAKIPTAQVLALFGTPQSILPAPGAGKANILIGLGIYKPAGTAYAGIATTEDLSVKYTDASGLELTACETTGFLDQATAQYRWVPARVIAQAAGAVADITPVANAALILMLLTGEITTGTSDLLLEIHYRVVPTVLA